MISFRVLLKKSVNCFDILVQNKTSEQSFFLKNLNFEEILIFSKKVLKHQLPTDDRGHKSSRRESPQ